MEKNLKERPSYTGSRKYSKSNNNYSKPAYTDNESYVSDDDIPEIETEPEPEKKTKSTIKSAAVAATGTLIFGLSWGLFLQLLVLVIVLAILAINIYHYLDYDETYNANIINATGNETKPICTEKKEIGQVGITNTLPITKRVVKQTAIIDGNNSTGLVDITVGANNKSIDLAGGETGTDVSDTYPKYTSKSKYINDTIDLALKKNPPKPPKKPKSDEEKGKEESVGGWCYIGSEGGGRNCGILSEGQSCNSGEIFGSREICINPNLRE
tara:strand:- start:243 stop:1049 length:807 start_codon:yes stop_codon:yes gene_type:complete